MSFVCHTMSDAGDCKRKHTKDGQTQHVRVARGLSEVRIVDHGHQVAVYKGKTTKRERGVSQRKAAAKTTTEHSTATLGRDVWVGVVVVHALGEPPCGD